MCEGEVIGLQFVSLLVSQPPRYFGIDGCPPVRAMNIPEMLWGLQEYRPKKVLNWLVLSDEQMSNKWQAAHIPYFAKWRSSEQLAGGWTIASSNDVFFPTVKINFLKFWG